MPETLVLLHGFAGTRHTWDRVIAQLEPQRYRPLALDLPGHGELSSYKRPITFEACVEAVLSRSPQRFALCGYSMGGRIALHVALAAPERVTRLILVSCSAGIDDVPERSERLRADGDLAYDLERIPFEDFIERWRDQPLFADDAPEVQAVASDEQRRNDPDALAAVVRGVGAGQMRPLWSRLSGLSMPVDVVVGERDAKYRELGSRMVALARRRSRLVVLEGGHRLPLERPEALASSLSEIVA